jgi:hypothetical protein
MRFIAKIGIDVDVSMDWFYKRVVLYTKGAITDKQ